VAAAGIALAIAGGALRAWCYRELGKYFTFEMSVAKDHRLVTTGPYSIVRHPSYTGGFMAITSIFLLHASQGSWVRESGLLQYPSVKIGAGIFASIIVVSPPALFVRMAAEDKALRKQFGDKWDAWATRVRYRIIPGIL
jgi:protein-S-isoprenylcysteine O-methyltransferase Ste14